MGREVGPSAIIVLGCLTFARELKRLLLRLKFGEHVDVFQHLEVIVSWLCFVVWEVWKSEEGWRRIWTRENKCWVRGFMERESNGEGGGRRWDPQCVR